jgi:predicted small lipoprotein YifL
MMKDAAARILGTAAFGAIGALMGCGQKGPLVLPPPTPAQQSRAPATVPETTPQPLDRPGARPFPDAPATGEPR